MSAFLLFDALETAIMSSQPQKARHLQRELAKLGWTVSYKKPEKEDQQKTQVPSEKRPKRRRGYIFKRDHIAAE